MTREIEQLLNTAREKSALEYANLELDSHALRATMTSRHPATAYFFSTEPKRHMSSLMYQAKITGRGVSPKEAAERLCISRQAATVILNETTDAGWTVKRRGKYMYADDMAEMYTQAVSEMLLTLSTSLTKNVEKLVVLREMASTHFTLTEPQPETILRTGGEHRETKKA